MNLFVVMCHPLKLWNSFLDENILRMKTVRSGNVLKTSCSSNIPVDDSDITGRNHAGEA